jgi:hypothetical protein
MLIQDSSNINTMYQATVQDLEKPAGDDELAPVPLRFEDAYQCVIPPLSLTPFVRIELIRSLGTRTFSGRW